MFLLHLAPVLLLNRIKRISLEILDKYDDLFTDDFDKNKTVLNQVVIVTSKPLRNKITGYITNLKKKEKESELILEGALEGKDESH